MNIYEKIQQCRVELQKLKLKKGGKNKFANFEYYELADFIPVVNELFLKHKLHSKFDITCIDGKEMAILTIINVEKPEEVETFSSPIADAEVKGCTPIQCLGGVHTYMKRYLYQNALEIVEPDLLDTVVGKQLEASSKTIIKEETKVSPSSPMSDEQKQIINSLDDDKKQVILNKYNTLDLTGEQASAVISSLKRKGLI